MGTTVESDEDDTGSDEGSDSAREECEGIWYLSIYLSLPYCHNDHPIDQPKGWSAPYETPPGSNDLTQCLAVCTVACRACSSLRDVRGQQWIVLSYHPRR